MLLADSKTSMDMPEESLSRSVSQLSLHDDALKDEAESAQKGSRPEKSAAATEEVRQHPTHALLLFEKAFATTSSFPGQQQMKSSC